MFIQKLTEHQIIKFRTITPLSINGEQIPYKIGCNGKFYLDPRGNTYRTIFLNDFDLTAPFADEQLQKDLNKHYIMFMIEEFGNEYVNALSINLFKNNSPETL